MTDQVPDFTLPSQGASRRGSDSPQTVAVITRIAKIALPSISAVALVVWVASRLFQRAQEKKLRDFQAQLASLSSMLDLDGAGKKDSAVDSATESAKVARQMLGGTGKRYQFRGDTTKQTEENIESKVRLDLFRAGSPKGEGSSIAEKVEIADVVPEGEYEKAIAESLKRAEGGDVNSALDNLRDGREKATLSEAQGDKLFDQYVSKVVSAQIDRAAVHLDSDDRESLQNLNHLAVTMAAAKLIGPNANLSYVGVHASGTRVKEELYRRYAVFCLSSEERVRNDLQSLVDMQTLLDVDDARAETINTEIAKGMFQVAVSAAMADGKLDQRSRDALDKLKESFGDLLDGGSADSIMSEVAVMRAMYSLQQLLQEQGVSEDDIKELRRMCTELGVDIDEMLRNADALGDALGPEAKEFIESLRGLLSENRDGSVVSTTAKPVEPSNDAESSQG